MYIILDQTKACYDAPDIFSGYCETIEELKDFFKFYSRNEDYQVTILDTTQKIKDGGYNCKEYTYKEIIKIIDNNH